MRRFKVSSALLALLLLFAAVGAASASGRWEQRIDIPDRDIVILYTNDVHCAVDTNIGYAGLASFRDEMLRTTPYVALVDCGDIVQGSVLGMITSGDTMIEIMNAVSYDIAITGNHEYDYGIPRLAQLIESSNASWLGVNIHYLNEGRSPLSKISRYKIMRFGPTKVAFIGVATPESFVSSTPKYFMDGDRYIWSFRGESAKLLYSDIQMAVEECRISGADYVILMTHTGDADIHDPFSSPEIVRNTFGIDAVIDGHDHHVIPSMYIRSKFGKLVPISSTGTQLNNIGRVVITRDGGINVGLISGWNERSKIVADKVAEIKARTEKTLSLPVSKTDTDLLITEGGVRTVRARENGLANLVADAFLASTGAEIGIVNGGSVRASIKAGEIKYGDILGVLPFGTNVCSIKATGKQIIDALEFGARFTQRQYSDGINAVGESGAFLHVSELRYTIDTSIPSPVMIDEHGECVGFKDAYRVSDVQVRRASGWEPIDPSATYVVGGSAYVLKLLGDGNTAFRGCETVIDDGTLDYVVLSEYLRDVLRGNTSRYRSTEGRITIK